jgi:hypothetical protein
VLGITIKGLTYLGMELGVNRVDEGFSGFTSPLVFWCSKVVCEVFKTLSPTLREQILVALINFNHK